MSAAPAGDIVERYVNALATFGEAVRDVADHEWDLPTPCTDWNVKEVVAHVVLTEAQLPSFLSGEMTHTQTSFSAELLGPNPLAAWRGTAHRAIEAARADGVADRLLEIDLGTVSGARLLGYRITDNIVHAWDIRVGIGRPEPIDAEQAEWLLDFWLPVAGHLGGGDFFAPPIEPPPGAPAGTRLLALLGRVAPPN